MMNEPVSSIMIKDLITAGPDDNLTTIKNIFRNKRIHHIPIVVDTKLVGLITNTDLLWLNKTFDEYEKILVKEIMTTKLAKLDPSAKIGTAAEIFLNNWFHAVPVVNDEGELVGLVTSFDILKYEFLKEYPRHEFLY